MIFFFQVIQIIQVTFITTTFIVNAMDKSLDGFQSLLKQKYIIEIKQKLKIREINCICTCVI